MEKLPLSYQTLLPNDYKENQSFREMLHILKKYGFSGIELNIEDVNKINPKELKDFLAEYELPMTMLATGYAAKQRSLFLSHPDEKQRTFSIRECIEFIEFAHDMGSGLILGLMKGPHLEEAKDQNELFEGSLQQLNNTIRENKIQFLIEATNRYETPVANTVNEAVSFIKDKKNPYLQVLPDTFHMNIEEISNEGVLNANSNYISSIHLSDNNRLLPGLGNINFHNLLNFLLTTGYNGRFAYEGKLKNDLENDLEESISYLAPILRKFNQ